MAAVGVVLGLLLGLVLIGGGGGSFHPVKNKNKNSDHIVIARELINNLLNAVFVPSRSDVSSQKCHIIDPTSGTFYIIM